ncbi:MAG: NAD(P) transhydrogenase subunit beta [endosymbiont of Galathealinum brachiosum]|uniref:NAD(P) transhydrogenase subunit beta n=1 Tax=endosymbiont of Galathealinum brachiosum TaxID=2200906 RepID=A0A370DEF6_9GAMM|nr:MAG: NAD(P) transhydrogenase subunit beta [endosymbiont of Galathealinum brachiosum]
MDIFIQVVYFVTAILFIMGLKKMSSPVTATGGIVWAGIAMVAASLVAFFEPGVFDHTSNVVLIVVAIAVGSGVAYTTAKRVQMTDMPQMIAIYNGMGGGAAAAIAAVELVKMAGNSDMPGMGHHLSATAQVLAVIGALIGAISFSGSAIAFAKLQGIMKKTIRLPMHMMINLILFALTLVAGAIIGFSDDVSIQLVLLFFVMALVFGVMFTTPIGGADMPVVISLFNALTGLAVAFEGYVLENAAMIIAGTVVGSAGTLLTQLMSKAMNRPISNILFASFGSDGGDAAEEDIEGSMKEIQGTDAAIMMAFAEKVIIVPGYGMAVAQAQHKVSELTKLLEARGVKVMFAIHPVAGRMPGHMNVLLAEAGIDYDKILDLDEVNPEFPTADVALVIGANDVVNPVARSNPDSPIYGMPILDADIAKNCIVIKRGKGSGFSGIENHLFYADNTRMLYGDGQKAVGELITGIKEL